MATADELYWLALDSVYRVIAGDEWLASFDSAGEDAITVDEALAYLRLYWSRTDSRGFASAELALWQADRILAVITKADDGTPRVTRFDRPAVGGIDTDNLLLRAVDVYESARETIARDRDRHRVEAHKLARRAAGMSDGPERDAIHRDLDAIADRTDALQVLEDSARRNLIRAILAANGRGDIEAEAPFGTAFRPCAVTVGSRMYVVTHGVEDLGSVPGARLVGSPELLLVVIDAADRVEVPGV